MKSFQLKPDQEKSRDEYFIKTREELDSFSNKSVETDKRSITRRRIGFRGGVFIGLSFGFVAELLNLYLVPGVFLSSPPFGALFNFLFYGFLGGCIGWIIALPEDSIWGISFGALAGIASIEIRAWLIPEATPLLQLIANPVVLLFALVVGGLMILILIPVMYLWRLCQENHLDFYRLQWWQIRKWRFYIVMMVVAMIGGSFFVYPLETRQTVLNMDHLVRTALTAKNKADLPRVLQTNTASKILEHTDQKYVIDLVQPLDLNDEMSVRTIFGQTGFSNTLTVSARFHDGWVMDCSFRSPTVVIICRGTE